MTEAEFINLIKDMTEEEKAEFLNFLQILHSREEEGRPVTAQEAYKMGVETKRRIASQQ